MDAVRLVVVVGAGMWMVPLLWPTSAQSEAASVTMSEALFYIFGVWLLLIAVSAVLVTRLRGDTPLAGQEEVPK